MNFKKYILFQYDYLYPKGGLRDIKDSFDTIEEAVNAASKNYCDNNEIVDRDSWETVLINRELSN